MTLYTHVDDIDFAVGGILERLVPGTVAGPTFLCIWAQHALRICQVDRFFYTHKDGPLTPEQLTEIQKVSLARLYCDNSKVEKIQKKAMFLPSLL